MLPAIQLQVKQCVGAADNGRTRGSRVYDGKTISVEMPNSVVREVIYTEPAVKGDTSGKPSRPPLRSN